MGPAKCLADGGHWSPDNQGCCCRCGQPLWSERVVAVYERLRNATRLHHLLAMAVARDATPDAIDKLDRARDAVIKAQVDVEFELGLRNGSGRRSA